MNDAPVLILFLRELSPIFAALTPVILGIMALLMKRSAERVAEVKKDLAISVAETRKDLAVATNHQVTKLDRIQEIINGGMSAQLYLHAQAMWRIHDLTGAATDMEAAKAAQEKYEKHHSILSAERQNKRTRAGDFE